MIKLVIEIKEENSIELKNIKAIGTNISIHEIGIMATKVEEKVSNMLKGKLNIDEKIQIENFSTTPKEDLKKELEKLLKRL